ncbi:uncharacterized protein LOC116786238 [Chiroxiphia lanceolata]|uniref:uncharacterized protein LOC116786238 n=1 Tax=Chiroxiphia lanceolata TaxID=296741 RepID=UPI0013CE940E|nr:uncharacterized protein LOC116786238 [Chiroxiphia lanceolata]
MPNLNLPLELKAISSCPVTSWEKKLIRIWLQPPLRLAPGTASEQAAGTCRHLRICPHGATQSRAELLPTTLGDRTGSRDLANSSSKTRERNTAIILPGHAAFSSYQGPEVAETSDFLHRKQISKQPSVILPAAALWQTAAARLRGTPARHPAPPARPSGGATPPKLSPGPVPAATAPSRLPPRGDLPLPGAGGGYGKFPRGGARRAPLPLRRNDRLREGEKAGRTEGRREAAGGHPGCRSMAVHINYSFTSTGVNCIGGVSGSERKNVWASCSTMRKVE